MWNSSDVQLVDGLPADADLLPSSVSAASNMWNSSDVHLVDGLSADADLLPSSVFTAYLWLVVGGGVLVNLALIITIMRCRARWSKDPASNELMLLLLHLAATDIASLALLAPCELHALRTAASTWLIAAAYCPLFVGLDTLLGVAVVYLLVALALHAATVKTPPDAADARVPLGLVWLTATSLSVPVFCFAGVVYPRPQHPLCTLLDQQNESLRGLQYALAVFRVGVPATVLGAAALVTTARLCDEARATQQHLFKISLALTVSYAVLSLHRSVFAVLQLVLGGEAFRAPPLAVVATSPTASLVFSMMHYVGSAVRPVLCFLASRRVRTICFCCWTGPRRNRPN